MSISKYIYKKETANFLAKTLWTTFLQDIMNNFSNCVTHRALYQF